MMEEHPSDHYSPDDFDSNRNSIGDTDPFRPLDASTHVVYENGRWIVLLNVTAWEPESDAHPVRNHWKRINDYSTEQEAQVAAQWIARSANRRIRPPSGF